MDRAFCLYSSVRYRQIYRPILGLAELSSVTDEVAAYSPGVNLASCALPMTIAL